MSAPANIAVGSIVAFASDDFTPLIAQGWAACDGSTLITIQYPELFAAIGYANGGSGDGFNLPDLRGYFIRGVQNEEVAQLTPYTTGAPLKSVTATVSKNNGSDYHNVTIHFFIYTRINSDTVGKSGPEPCTTLFLVFLWVQPKILRFRR